MPWIRKIHKWTAVFVGLQFLLWLSSGLYFNVMDMKKATGSTYKVKPQATNIDDKNLIEPRLVLANFAASISLTPIQLLAKPYYLLTHQNTLYSHLKNSYTLVDAITGKQVIIDEKFAKKLALSSYNGPGKIKDTTFIKGKISDFPKEQNSAWQINFNDQLSTSVYIDANSARIIGHSDDEKRFADIFFMLHFMDYGNVGGFNSIQIILFAFVTLWLSLTGLIWTIDLGLRGQYQLKWFAKNREVRLFDKHQKSIGLVNLPTHTNLLDGLVEHNITLPSTCGGGGTCGRCKVMIDPASKTTSADQLHFNELELQQGYRLACQHFSHDVEHMTLFDVTDAQKYQLELTQSIFISPTIKELRFKVMNNKNLTFKAGAFMRFFIPAANGVSIPKGSLQEQEYYWQNSEYFKYQHDACSRSYSLANGNGSSLNGTNELVFAIKIQTAPSKQVNPGIASNYLCNLDLGQTVNAVGPFEEFYAHSDTTKTMILVGAGSGMAPLKSIIEEQLKKAENNTSGQRAIHFYFGARTEVELVYRNKFHHLSGEQQNFNYIPVLSQADSSWHGVKGYVQQQLLRDLDSLGDIDNLEFYLCGPAKMMSETISLLKAKGINEQSIYFDDFS
jgi:Na+-transporting NADH:ubiquinone oxidoreductase subunit F